MFQVLFKFQYRFRYDSIRQNAPKKIEMMKGHLSNSKSIVHVVHHGASQ